MLKEAAARAKARQPLPTVQTSAPRRKKSAEEQLVDLGLLTKTTAEIHAELRGKAAPPESEYMPEVQVKAIYFSPTNPRKTINEAKLQELAESIKRHGVVEPLIIRPGSPHSKPGFELIAGERRLRAAQLAGLATVPCRLYRVSDAMALEMQLIENLQRDDLDPMEEAEGFEAAMTKLNWTATDLAAKVGKSVGYIYGTQKLLLAPEVARKALAAGETTTEVVKLIGRIPNEKVRKEAALEIMGKRYGSPMTVKQTREHIERYYMVELKAAPFKQDDDKLTPAGPCTTCPARTGNKPDLYPNSRADICTDPACFHDKVLAQGERRLEEARKSGQSVLGRGEKYFWPHSGQLKTSGYVDLDDRCWEDAKNRTYRLVLGAELKELPMSVGIDCEGKFHELAPKEKVHAIIRKKLPSSSRTPGSTFRDRRDSFDDKVKAKARTQLMKLAAERAEQKGSIISSWPLWLRPLVVYLISEFWSDIVRQTASRRDVKDLRELAGELQNYQLLPLLVEMCVCKGANGHGPADELLEMLEIDPSAIEKQVRNDLKAAKAAKGKK